VVERVGLIVLLPALAAAAKVFNTVAKSNGRLGGGNSSAARNAARTLSGTASPSDPLGEACRSTTMSMTCRPTRRMVSPSGSRHAPAIDTES
jgi:hypothetical protein